MHKLVRTSLTVLVTFGLVSLMAACDTQNQPAPGSTPVPSPTQAIAPTLPDTVSTPEQLYPADPSEQSIQNLPVAPATLTYNTASELTAIALLPTPAPTPTDTPIPPPTDTPNAEQNAIELVRNATLRTANSTPYVTSYPHIYSGDYSGSGIPDDNIGTWPDKPGSKGYYYIACGGVPEPTIEGGHGNYLPCDMPMTLTVALTFDPSQNAYTVIFSCAWIGRNAPDGSHSWTYQVDANQQVTFLREEGAVLPTLAE